MRKLWQTSKVKMGEESIKPMKSRTQRVYSKFVHKGEGGVKKSVRRYVRTKWIAQTNVVEYFLCIGLAKYIRASLTITDYYYLPS